MTNPETAAVPRPERLEIPAQALRDTIIRLFDTIGGSPEERSAFLRNPQEYLARHLPAEKTRQQRFGSIDAVLAALAEPVRDGTSGALAQLVELAFSTEPQDRGAASHTAPGTRNLSDGIFSFFQNFTYNQNQNVTVSFSSSVHFNTRKSGVAEGDPRQSPARLRAALEAYGCK